MSAIPLIATASDDEVSLWEGGGGEEPLATFEPHLEPITALRWTSNDRVLASASHDGTIALSEPSGKLFHTLQAQPTSGGASSAVAIHAITWSPGSRYLAAGGSDAVVRIFDLQKRAQALALRGHRAAVRGLSWSPSEVYVASSSDAGEIIVHRVQGSVAAVARIEHPAAEGMVRPGLGAVQWAPFHPSMLACAAADGGVAVWEVKPNAPTGPPQPDRARVPCPDVTMAHVHEANVGYRQRQTGLHQRQLEAPLLIGRALGIHEHAHVHVRMQSFGKLGLHRRDRVRIGEF